MHITSRVLLALCALAATRRSQAQDTVRVRADNAPRWGTTIRLVKLYSVGRLDDPEGPSGVIDHITTAPNGALFVYDSKDTVIRRYDASGKFLGKVGRSGSGPGEFRGVHYMGVANDTTLVLWDGALMRMSLFSLGGAIRSSFNITRGSAFLSEGGEMVVEPGGLLRIQSMVPDPAAVPGASQYMRAWIRYRLDGKIVDTTVPPPAEVRRTFCLMTGDGCRPNFTDDRVTAPYAVGGTLVGWPRPYRIAMPAANGRVLVVDRAYQPVPIVGEERAQWIVRAEEFNSAPPIPGRAPDGPFSIADTKPGFRELRSDPLGRVWVEVNTRAEKRVIPPRPAGDTRPLLTWRERNAYDVISPDGQFLGHIDLEANTTIGAIQKSTIWLMTKGADGEDIVTAYRIQGPTGP